MKSYFLRVGKVRAALIAVGSIAVTTIVLLPFRQFLNSTEDAFEQASDGEALRRSEKLKSALLDAVTHDLRTPLTSIKASVTTLLNEPGKTELDDESRREFLEIIDEETDRLNDFIEGMVGVA